MSGSVNEPSKACFINQKHVGTTVPCEWRRVQVMAHQLQALNVALSLRDGVMNFSKLIALWMPCFWLCCDFDIGCSCIPRQTSIVNWLYSCSRVVSELFKEIREYIGGLYELTECVSMLDILVAFTHNCTLSDYGS